MFYAKCIHESTFGTKRPVLPITREQFMRFTINTFVTFAIIAAVVFLFLFFQRIPYELSFCTVFFSILAFFFFSQYLLYTVKLMIFIKKTQNLPWNTNVGIKKF